MKFIPTLALAALAGLFVSLPAQAAQMIELADTPTQAANGRCSQDGEYCLRLDRDVLTIMQSSTGARAAIPGLPVAEGQRVETAGWLIELEPGHILAGVKLVSEQGITGGRFQRKDLVLWDVTLANSGVVGPVLDFPAETHIDIDNDCRNWPAERPRPCKATFSYGGIVIVQQASTEGYPALTFRTTAMMQPVAASREYGWRDTGMMSSDDTGLNMECSFQRVLNYNPLAAHYQVDQSLPECAEYFEPELLPKRAIPWSEEVWMREATDAEIRAFHPAPDALIGDRKRDPELRIELGWLYNEMFAGSDVIVMRASKNKRCVAGECDLMFFGVNNCIEPAKCRPKWSKGVAGNRVYSLHKPAVPLDISCPNSAILIPAGPGSGQYCITNRGITRSADVPDALAENFPKE